MVRTNELIEIETNVKAIEMGNLACPGCQLNLAFKHSLSALGGDAVVVVPACCTSVIQGTGDGYGMNVPIFNTAFASAPPVASGIARKLRLEGRDTQVVVWAGDGGTTDIGFASLSGIAERDEPVIYFSYNNQGYQNTGNQKSGATPRAAKTTTTSTGKTSRPKNVARMMLAQDVKYVARANAAYPRDLFDKITRAATEFKDHFRFIEIYSPCPPGWTVDTRDIVEVGKLANETGAWPSWEAVDGEMKLSKISKRFRDPSKRKPVKEFFELQGRFAGVDEALLKGFEEDIDFEWKWMERYIVD